MLAKVDGRTKESRLMAATRAELTRHVGGSPSSVQKALIERGKRYAATAISRMLAS